MKPWRHFKTITHHRLLVMINCFRIGLIRQGLSHDLSKYSPTEFWAGARYYQGIRSPNAAEREQNGYSAAWLHHKGRNRHHYEYWTDLNPTTRQYEPVPMPRRYLAEMVMDRIAASKVYLGRRYTNAAPLEYFRSSHEGPLMHRQTERQLAMLLTMLRDQGEAATFRFIRETVLPGKDF
ncbi:MAG: DUF5662 family protein [Oscillospiraceae bacterium]|mgnify:FL=1|jgi:hypothetical protein|nr:catalase [Bacillota bacterium]